MSEALLELTVNGSMIRVREGTSVAAAILNAREITPPTWTPLCGMGVCWGCRATIDGRPDRRSCLVPVAPGMQVSTAAAIENDRQEDPVRTERETSSI